MSIKGNKGVKIFPIEGLVNKFEYFFGEDQGRYIIEVKKNDLENVKKILEENSVYFDELGIVNKENLQFNDELNISIEALSMKYKTWLENYMVN